MSNVEMTMAQVVNLTGVSEASVRNITSGRFAPYYVDFLSAGARPGIGQPRTFTEGDVTLIAYIASRTKEGKTHEEVAAEVRAGALADFTPPEVTAREAEQARKATRPPQVEPQPSAALVSVDAISRELTRVMGVLLERLEVDNAKLQDGLRAVTARAAASQREVELLRAQLQQAEARTVAAQGEVEKLRQELAAAQLQRRTVEARAVSAENERDSLKTRVMELGDELAAARRGVVARLFRRG